MKNTRHKFDIPLSFEIRSNVDEKSGIISMDIRGQNAAPPIESIVMNTLEDTVRKSLIVLGWTPPIVDGLLSPDLVDADARLVFENVRAENIILKAEKEAYTGALVEAEALIKSLMQQNEALMNQQHDHHDWHDMETAPTDGTPLLFKCKSGLTTIEHSYISGKIDAAFRGNDPITDQNDRLTDHGLVAIAWRLAEK